MSQYAMVDITQLNTATIKKSIIDFDELKDMEHVIFLIDVTSTDV